MNFNMMQTSADGTKNMLHKLEKQFYFDITERRMQFITMLFKVNYVRLIGFLVLFNHEQFFSGASIILTSDDIKLQQDDVFNQRHTTKENTNFVMADIQFRLDFMEKDINWLKTENQNQKEEIHLLKNQSDNQKQEIYHLNNQKDLQEKVILQLKSTIEQFLGSNDSLGISNKRTVRNITPEPTAKNSTTDKQRTEIESPATDIASTSWAKLEISDRVIGYMDYDTYTVKIFDHATNKHDNMKNENKKYYFEPIGQLNHLSAKSDFNNISKKFEMTFDVNMWDENVREAVYKFISDDMQLGPVNKNFVRVLPLDNVAIYNEIAISPNFEIEQSWIDYKSDKYLTFKFICDRLKPCEDLALQMKSNPKQFRFKIRFSVSSQISQTRETKISIESIIHGNMINELDQKHKGKVEVLLTGKGKKTLIKESAGNVIIQTIDDTQVPSENAKDAIYNILEKMLDFSHIIIRKGDDKAWENVFWDEDNYRPDKLANTLNDIHQTLDEENRKKLEESFTSTSGVETEVGAKARIISAHSKFAAGSSRGGSTSKENLQKLLDDAKDCVEWYGERFVPKQMELYSLNMERLRDRKAFAETYINVSYRTSMLSIDVRYDLSMDSCTSSELLKLGTQISSLTAMFDTSFLKLENGISHLQAEIKEMEHVKRKGKLSRIPPSSCQTLSEMGHYLDGLYLIREITTKKLLTIYCQFQSTSVSQNVIGHVDVKTKHVHFYVQRSSNFGTGNAVIPFGSALLNEGNAFELANGIFTVPVPGIYHFDFAGVKEYYAKSLEISLEVNGKTFSYSLTQYYGGVSLSASLRLAKFDRVNLQLCRGLLYNEHTRRYTHFSGWLVKEDLI